MNGAWSKELLINLAPMECFTSCVASYLNLSGKDYKKLLLQYWNINYQYKTLLSSKNPREMSLSFIYGIDVTLVNGPLDELHSSIREGRSVIFMCKASRLFYFPEKLLALEDSGFQHCILILGWNEATDSYIVADPIIGFLGEMSEEELRQAGQQNQKHKNQMYFTLDDAPSSFVPPAAEELFAHSFERNLLLFENPPEINLNEQDGRKRWAEYFFNRKGGHKALDLFMLDLKASKEWTPAARNKWIKGNNITIGSIIKLRSLVWNSLSEMPVLTESQRKSAEVQISSILKAWQLLNYWLVKYMSQGNKPGLVASIEQQVILIQSAELAFLREMKQLAVSGLGVRP